MRPHGTFKALLAALVGVLALVAACTEMPTIRAHNPSNQLKVTSARHWLPIAKDVADSIAKAPTGAGCVVFEGGESTDQSMFQRFMVNAVTEDLLTSNSSASSSTKMKVYRSWPAGEACDEIAINSVAVRHPGVSPETYPGKYTLLATGVVVIRNIVRAFSEASAIGGVALGEGAFWASSGFRWNGHVIEITVSTSRFSKEGQYLSQYVDVYYVDSDDASLYASPSPPAVGPIDVIPDRVDNCADWPAFFTVTGNVLVAAEQSYFLGSVQASRVDPELGGRTGGNNRRVYFSTPADFKGRTAPLTLAMIAPDGSIRTAQIRVDDARCAVPPPIVDVSPRTVSACDTSADFFVTGSDIENASTDYLLGASPASSAKVVTHAAHSRVVEVHFTNLNKANIGVSELTLSVARSGGTANRIPIEVEGTAASCAKTKGNAATTSLQAPKTTPIVLSAVGGKPADQVDVCHLPVKLAVSGTGASTVSGPSVLGGAYSGSVEQVSNGKTSTVTLVFDKLPNFKDEPPDGDLLEVALKVGAKKLTVNVPVKCNP